MVPKRLGVWRADLQPYLPLVEALTRQQVRVRRMHDRVGLIRSWNPMPVAEPCPPRCHTSQHTAVAQI